MGFSLISSYSNPQEIVRSCPGALGLSLEKTWCVSVHFNHFYAGAEMYQDLPLPKINLHVHPGMHWVHGLVSGEMCLWLFCKLMWTCISALGLSLTGTLGCDSENPCFYFCLFPGLNVWPQSINPSLPQCLHHAMIFSLQSIIKVVKYCLEISIVPQQNIDFFHWFCKLVVCKPH